MPLWEQPSRCWGFGIIWEWFWFGRRKMITSLARQNSNENFSSGIQSLKTVPKQPPSTGSAGRFFFEDECPSDFIIKKTAQVTVDYACNAGDPGSIPTSGRSPGEENGNLLQNSCLENSMDRPWGLRRVRHDWATNMSQTLLSSNSLNPQKKSYNAGSIIILTIHMQKQSHRKVKQTAGVFIINK